MLFISFIIKIKIDSGISTNVVLWDYIKNTVLENLLKTFFLSPRKKETKIPFLVELHGLKVCA